MSNTSFLKWAGGKKGIINTIVQHLPEGERLVEPFVGSGCVFLNTNYSSYLLNDNNEDIISLFKYVKDKPDELLNKVEYYYRLDSINYYKIRNKFNKTLYTLDRAAMFIYLNRFGFNGLCRYNKDGKFNVAVGMHKTIRLPSEDLILFSTYLNKVDVTLTCLDYKNTLDSVKKGDVVYCDPPYLSLNNNASFTGYKANSFDINETINLKNKLIEINNKGIPVIVSNHDTPVIRDIFKDFKIHQINVRRFISCNGNRNTVPEILGLLS